MVGGDFILCHLCVIGARVILDVSIGGVVACRSTLDRVDLLFVGRVGCPSAGQWITPARTPPMGGVLSLGGGGGLCVADNPTRVPVVHESEVR